MLNSTLQMSYYLGETINGVITSTDETMEYLYEYQTSEGESIIDILSNEQIDETDRSISISEMMRKMLDQNKYISSIRIATKTGQSYSIFRKGGVTLKISPVYCPSSLFERKANYRDLAIVPTRSMFIYSNDSDGYAFSLVRNLMNTKSISLAESDALATVYVDVDVSALERYVENMDLGENGRVYIVNLKTHRYLYNMDSVTYKNNEDPLLYYTDYISDQKASVIVDDVRLIYRKIDDTDYYVVAKMYQQDLQNTYMENFSFMFILIAFVLFVLITLYMIYSGKVSEPARQLKKAMQEVQTGNLNVSVDIQSNDEFQYLGEGFNKMIQDLNYFVSQVYIAQLRRKEAELAAMKMQIQPHFLYNTLDIIRMTALENKDEQTAELLESLSAQMRYVMNADEERVELRRELDHILEYFSIIRVRYNGRFGLKINVANEDLHLVVPKLSVQPIVENAVKHGLRQKKGSGMVNIDVTHTEDKLEISVMDDGVGMSEEECAYVQGVLDGTYKAQAAGQGHVGIGLKNISDRIKMNFGVSYGIIVVSYEQIGTIVKLMLPILEEEEDVESTISG
jgi:two-component system sensor histidine kinase YesM